MKPRCAIVDAYGPSQFYFESLIQRGFDIIHIQSSKDIPAHFSKMATDKKYLKHMVYDRNITKVLNDLSSFSPISFLFAGFETGIELADALTKSLGLIGNNPQLTSIRSDKYKTLALLSNVKLIPMQNYICQNHDMAIKWIHQNLNYPIVMKPTNSAGSQGVFICNNDQEVIDNFKVTLDQPNVLGHITKEIIIQSFLEGQEYIVNTVSCQGVHYVSDMWESTKRFVDGRFVYDSEELLLSTGEIQSILTSYIVEVLDTLGIQNGPSHSELILTENGPVILEVNPRIHGGIFMSAQNECLGHNQLDLTLDAYINPKRFLEYIRKPYELKKEMMLVVGINPCEGMLTDIPEIDDFKKIESYRFHRMRVKKEERIKKTVDLASAPLFVYLVADTKKQLKDDYSRIQTLIKEGFKIEK